MPRKRAHRITRPATARMRGRDLVIVLRHELPGGNQYLGWRWWKRTRFRQDLALELRATLHNAFGRVPAFGVPVELVGRRSYFAVPLDDDNLAYAFKSITDVLIRPSKPKLDKNGRRCDPRPNGIGVIVDDSPQWKRLRPMQRKRLKKIGPVTIIRVRPWGEE